MTGRSWIGVMKAAPAPSSRARIVARLRTAGCVSAEDEARLLIESAGTPTELAVMVDRRVAGEPIEHILGWAEFCGLRIALAPGVFVPRRRTEFLVDQARMLAGQIVGPAGPSSSICAAAPGRSVPRWPRRWTSSCTPWTLIRRRFGVPAATSVPSVGWCTQATSMRRCPLTCTAGSRSSPPMRRTFLPRTSGCCPSRPACTSHGPRSTAGQTGSTCSAGSPPRRHGGSPGRAPAGRDQRVAGAADDQGGWRRRDDPADHQLRGTECTHRRRNPPRPLTTGLRPAARAPIRRGSARTLRRRTRRPRSCPASPGGSFVPAPGRPSP